MKYNPMKILISKMTVSANLVAYLLAVGLALNLSAVVAKDAETTQVADAAVAKIVSLTNPSASYGVQIGDKLSRKVVLDVPMPYQIAKEAFPKKGKKANGIELVEVNVETDQQKTRTLYTVNLGYQAFTNTNTPAVMQLPAEQFTLTGGEKSMAIDLPAWGFWFSPLVSGGIETAQKNIQPEFTPPLVAISAHQTRLILFLSVLVASLLALLYINADGNWLPFMGGAFAQAHRQLKRLSKSSVAKTAKEEKQALVYIHQAFNKLYRANIFARDIDRFVTMRPSFKKMKGDIEQFFNYSNQSLYSIEARDSAKVIQNLVQLSKQLRDCERGV
jgi:mxaA protein